MTANQSRESDLDRVLAIVDKISGARHESLLWLQHPLKEFDDQTPEHLVAMGRANDVIGYLNSISSGFVG